MKQHSPPWWVCCLFTKHRDFTSQATALEICLLKQDPAGLSKAHEHVGENAEGTAWINARAQAPGCGPTAQEGPSASLSLVGPAQGTPSWCSGALMLAADWLEKRESRVALSARADAARLTFHRLLSGERKWRVSLFFFYYYYYYFM